jgi:bifunctional polynucleotide phosphatase/kinase
MQDFACTDRKFAHNIGLLFKTPEEYFLGETPCKTFNWESIDPTTIKSAAAVSDTNTAIAKSTQEIIVLCGLPASGKSTFARKHLISAGYVPTPCCLLYWS